MRINVTSGKPLSVASYGLKDHSRIPVDILEDGTCDLRTYDSLFAMRNPDTISTIRYNDKTYVVTSNEGDYKKYEGFSERYKAKDLFTGSSFALPQMTVPTKIFDPQNIMSGHAALFNEECEGDKCVDGTRLSVGSVAIDYHSDPTNPIFYRMVLFGGRGWSVYELPENPDNLLKLVFDSRDYLERRGCESYPWAHNAALDEEFAPTTNLPNNTLWESTDDELREVLIEMNDPEQDGCFDQGDGTPGACPMGKNVDARSGYDGSGIERAAIGVACGRLVAVMATEKSSTAYLFDITNIATPALLDVFHLSEATQSKSPGLAYNDGTIGEIDPENMIFLPATESPTGKASVIWAGAHSGTISYWEFDCVEPDSTTVEQTEDNNSSSAGRFMKASYASLIFAAAMWATLG
uniref:Alkaline phosphatase n=1 Tax=Entomoneis paludosa TaxID=265537 RepID=A0A6U2Y7X6_9STRA